MCRQGRSHVGAWGAMAPPNFLNSPLELVKKKYYKLLKLHVNLFTDPQILELTLSKFKIGI